MLRLIVDAVSVVLDGLWTATGVDVNITATQWSKRDVICAGSSRSRLGTIWRVERRMRNILYWFYQLAVNDKASLFSLSHSCNVQGG